MLLLSSKVKARRFLSAAQISSIPKTTIIHFGLFLLFQLFLTHLCSRSTWIKLKVGIHFLSPLLINVLRIFIINSILFRKRPLISLIIIPPFYFPHYSFFISISRLLFTLMPYKYPVIAFQPYHYPHLLSMSLHHYQYLFPITQTLHQ